MFRHSFFSRFRMLLLLTGLALTGLTLQYPRAQQTNPDPAQGMKEIQELLDSVEDIGEMKFLNPLRLTTAQIDKLVPLITAAQTEYNSQLAAANQESLKKIANDIRAARRQAVTGKSVSTEANDRINKAIDAHLKSIKARQDDALKNLSQKIRNILLSEQYATAAKLAKEETEKINQNAKGTEDQWFNLYVKSVVMGYPRIVPLLKDIRAAREEGRTASSAPEKGGENSAPR